MEGKKDEVSMEGKVPPFIVYLLLFKGFSTKTHIYVPLGK